jgi:bromodomain adjacent to zinc finger domain protein 1A
MRNMPCLKRKEVFNDFNSDPNDLEPDEYIFYIPFTKEKFRNYNEFYKKMAFYQSKHWQCKVTGKTGLTYLEALNSEKSAEQKLLLLPEVYFKPLLAIIQYNSLTFEHLVEEIWRVFQNCYFVGEKVIYHEEGSSCLCEVVAARKEHASEFIEEFSIKLETEEIKQHKYDVVRCSDQKFYRNINGTQLNRQKNPLTKNIIRQFIREVAYKDRYVGAPWIVSVPLYYGCIFHFFQRNASCYILLIFFYCLLSYHAEFILFIYF